MSVDRAAPAESVVASAGFPAPVAAAAQRLWACDRRSPLSWTGSPLQLSVDSAAPTRARLAADLGMVMGREPAAALDIVEKIGSGSLIAMVTRGIALYPWCRLYLGFASDGDEKLYATTLTPSPASELPLTLLPRPMLPGVAEWINAVRPLAALEGISILLRQQRPTAANIYCRLNRPAPVPTLAALAGVPVALARPAARAVALSDPVPAGRCLLTGIVDASGRVTGCKLELGAIDCSASLQPIPAPDITTLTAFRETLRDHDSVAPALEGVSVRRNAAGVSRIGYFSLPRARVGPG
jgi:hypothetical protein